MNLESVAPASLLLKRGSNHCGASSIQPTHCCPHHLRPEAQSDLTPFKCSPSTAEQTEHVACLCWFCFQVLQTTARSNENNALLHSSLKDSERKSNVSIATVSLVKQKIIPFSPCVVSLDPRAGLGLISPWGDFCAQACLTPHLK